MTRGFAGQRGVVYFDALKNFPEGILEAAIVKVVADERFFPSAAVLREAASGIMAGKLYEPSACPTCHGDTSKALIAYAKQLGADYLSLDGAIDGLLLHSGRVFPVDWKSPGATLTETQAKLTAAGWPIAYLSTPEQVMELLKSEGR